MPADNAIFCADRSWPSVTSVPPLLPNEVHVWRVVRDVPAPLMAGLRDLLSPDERVRAGRFRVASDGRRFAATRGILRSILGAYTGAPAGTLRFQCERTGKPALAWAGPHNAPCFSLAHSGALMVAAVAQTWAVGVDVEEMLPLPDADTLARRYFSMAELAALRALPPELRLRGFYTCWTRKEAFVKATGEGFARGLGGFEVSVGPQAALVRMPDDPTEAEGWSLQDIPVGAGYAAALAVAAGGERARLRLLRVSMDTGAAAL